MTGRPIDSGALFVRFEAGKPGCSARLHLSARLWRAIGSPQYIDVEATTQGCKITASTDGYSVTVPQGLRGGTPRISIGVHNAEAIGLSEPCRYEEDHLRIGTTVIGTKTVDVIFS